MVALVKGQNAPLTAERIRITVETAAPADLSALLLTATGKVRSDADFAFYNQPTVDGVVWRQAGAQQLDVDLTALPPNVERVLAVVSLDDRGFGGVAAPVARLADAAGGELGTFEISGLRDERAVIAWEVYRRAGTWKYRAVGQGYAGGLAQLISAYGVAVEDAPPPPSPVATVNAPPVRQPPRPAPTPPPVAPPPATPPADRVWPSSVPPATIPEMTIRPPSVPIETAPVTPQPGFISDDERMYDVLWKIFEDAARATAALRSATGYADQRRDNELSDLMSDPRARNSPHTESARAAAEQRHDELVARATADFKRDIGTLVRELQQISGQLPAPMAAWDSPAWQGWRPVEDPAVAIRIGELQVAEAPELRVPMVFRLPMRTPLWIDSADGKRGEATALARTLVVRLLAAYPPGRLRIHVADLVGGGAAAKALQPLTEGVVYPPATTPQLLSEMLGRLTERVDLMQMAAQADALDTLEGKVDSARQVLVLHDFPYGFDDRAVAQLRFLIEEGPAAGVHLIFVADPSDATTLGPLVSSLWRSMLRLSATPDDHIGDPWVGLSWTYTPDAASGAPTVESVLTRLADRT
jgi:stress response protein SCP2